MLSNKAVVACLAGIIGFILYYGPGLCRKMQQFIQNKNRQSSNSASRPNHPLPNRSSNSSLSSLPHPSDTSESIIYFVIHYGNNNMRYAVSARTVTWTNKK